MGRGTFRPFTFTELHSQKGDLTLNSNDQSTTVDALKKLVKEFVEERDWSQFHSPKNLSMALAIEVAELMEHFQWITLEASRELANNQPALDDVAEELADVMCYSLAIANELGIDISQAMQKKMVKNRIKYPAAEFRGRYGPQDKKPPTQ
jgi:NTP pyrophosphatase (non-canonical NTP hydrolase)